MPPRRKKAGKNRLQILRFRVNSLEYTFSQSIKAIQYTGIFYKRKRVICIRLSTPAGTPTHISMHGPLNRSDHMGFETSLMHAILKYFYPTFVEGYVFFYIGRRQYPFNVTLVSLARLGWPTSEAAKYFQWKAGDLPPVPNLSKMSCLPIYCTLRVRFVGILKISAPTEARSRQIQWGKHGRRPFRVAGDGWFQLGSFVWHREIFYQIVRNQRLGIIEPISTKKSAQISLAKWIYAAKLGHPNRSNRIATTGREKKSLPILLSRTVVATVNFIQLKVELFLRSLYRLWFSFKKDDFWL